MAGRARKDSMRGRGKVRAVMHEFKRGDLHSGKGGPAVRDRKQAVAIAMSEAGMAKRKG